MTHDGAYILGPEFHRQLWLRITPLRLLATPIILGLVSMVTVNFSALTESGAAAQQVAYEALATTMLTIYFFVVIVWGTLEAATSVGGEVRGNTWDFQCMSSISPAQLAFGKLFGATSYTWFFGLQALAIFAFAYGQYHGPSWRQSPPEDDTFLVVAGCILAGLVAQSAAFLHYLGELSNIPGRTARTVLPGGMGSFLLGLAVGGLAFSSLCNLASHFSAASSSADVHWYGESYDARVFTLCSLVFFAGWFLTGAWRLTRLELMQRNQPWFWMAFLVSAIVWDCGFILSMRDTDPTRAVMAAGFAAFLQAALVAYVSMLQEAQDLRRYARLEYNLKSGDSRRVLEDMPRWCTAAAIAVAFLLIQAASTPGGDDAARLLTLSFAVALFMIRDGVVMHIIQALPGQGKRFALIFYYVLVYCLLPLVVSGRNGFQFGLLDPANVDSAQTNSVVAFFYPSMSIHAYAAVLPPFAEILLAAVVLLNILHRRRNPGIIANPKA